MWPQTVCKWRQRFLESRLDGLTDEPRPGAPRTIDDERIEQVVVATLERQPADATHWSRASMAKESGLSKSTVGRIWKAFALKPHLVDTFKLSNDLSSSTRSATSWGCIWTRRKRPWCCAWTRIPDPGAGPLSAGAADDARVARTPHPRLRALRHHHLVRRFGRGHRAGLRLDPSPAPCRRVQEVPDQTGCSDPR